MKLSSLTTPTILMEMAAKKVCPVCGHGMVNNHYYYQGGWRCKSSSLAAPDVAAAKQSAADLTAAGYPATLDGLRAHTQGLAPGTMKAPTTQAPKSTKVAAPSAPAVSAATVPTYSGNQEKIANWLKTNNITNFTINEDSTVAVDGDLILDGLRHTKLPVKFNTVSGSVSLVAALLETLEGLPDEVGGDLNISSLKLKSMEGFPTKVHGDVHLGKTNVASSTGGSKLAHVGGDLIFHHYDADSFIGLPEYVGGDFIVTDCPSLKSLKGMPKEIGGDCKFPARVIKSLTGLSQKIGGDLEISSPGFIADASGLGEVGGSLHLRVRGSNFKFSYLPRTINGDLTIETDINGITSLEGFPEKVNGSITLDPSKLTTPGMYHKHIKSMNGVLELASLLGDWDNATNKRPLIGKNVLSIPMIKGIKRVDIGNWEKLDQFVTDLLNKCIVGDIDIHDVQEQLIDAGYGQLARL